MTRDFSHSDLEAYLDEELEPQAMADIEESLHNHPDLVQQLGAINGRRDAGLHTLGEIWRRNRVSCPTREQLGSFLLRAGDAESLEYIEFHLEQVGCRYCLANLKDLQRQQEESKDEKSTRRRKYFDSSAGYLQNE